MQKDWISVDYDTPTCTGDYLVTIDDGKKTFMRVCHYLSDTKLWVTGFGEVPIDDGEIVAWLPIPQPAISARERKELYDALDKLDEIVLQIEEILQSRPLSYDINDLASSVYTYKCVLNEVYTILINNRQHFRPTATLDEAHEIPTSTLNGDLKTVGG